MCLNAQPYYVQRWKLLPWISANHFKLDTLISISFFVFLSQGECRRSIVAISCPFESYQEKSMSMNSSRLAFQLISIQFNSIGQSPPVEKKFHFHLWADFCRRSLTWFEKVTEVSTSTRSQRLVSSCKNEELIH